MDKMLEVIDLNKRFKLNKKERSGTKNRYKYAVKNLNFNVYKGEIYGLLGPNGAGKTTTLRMIASLIKPYSGTIMINGECALNNENVKRYIGFLTSELKLEDYFTPNYLFNYFAKIYGFDYYEIDRRKEELFKILGIDDFANTKYGNLSTGMKQKVSICISLIHDPELIIFDEPTNGLDIIAARNVTEFLKYLKQQGKTIIISTHIFSLVEGLCDRVGIILDGNMKKEFVLEEIKKEGISLEERFFEIYYQEGENDAAINNN